MRRVRDREVIAAHAQLIGISMQRRKDRGKTWLSVSETNNLLQLIESSAGGFQAVLGGQVVSSNVILMAEKAGYNHTQGTSHREWIVGRPIFSSMKSPARFAMKEKIIQPGDR